MKCRYTNRDRGYINIALTGALFRTSISVAGLQLMLIYVARRVLAVVLL